MLIQALKQKVKPHFKSYEDENEPAMPVPEI